MSNSQDDPLDRLQRKVERLFHGLVYHRHPACHFGETAWTPAIDVVVSPHEARILVELAGVSRQGVQVQLQGHVLEISGRRKPPADLTDAHYQLAEIFFGDFRRTIELPWQAEAESVTAKHRDGMLEIQLQRAQVDAPDEITIDHERSE
jgi:HSP20 family protein